MPQGDLIGRMTDEVVRDMEEKKVHFKTAFAWAAHRLGVYWHHQRDYYNELFTKVSARVKKRKNNKDRKLPTRPKRSITPGERIHLRGRRPYLDKHPDKGYLYRDDEGYVHRDTPFLPEAPC